MVSLEVQVAALLKKYGVYISKATEKELINELISKFKPIDPGIDLIRIGGNYDGGYLVPDDLEGIKYLFSPGVDVTATFEYDCLQRGIVSFLADYSVDKPPVELKGCTFIKKFVGGFNSDKIITLEKWINESLPEGYNGDMMLQMDIEGAEYETLLATPPEILQRFRILVMEFHNFQKLDNKEYFKFVNAAMDKIGEFFSPVHLHPNNCCGIANVNGVLAPRVFEATFLRKDRVKHVKRPVVLPHPLDQPNFKDKKDILLPQNWLN